LIKLEKEISDLETKAEKNLAEDKEFLPMKIDELDGVPADFIEALKKKRSIPGKPGWVNITLDKNKVGAFMGNFDREATREKLKEAMDMVN
jgi:Zn-dependent oligopeptidase